MFEHKQIWAAFEAVAEKCGMSLSALSKSAGFDPTSFNPSKRFGPGGRKRWPSTETLSRVLSVAKMDMKTFAKILEAQTEPGSSRRRYKRFPSILEGRIGLKPQDPQLPCRIRDISASGARLWLPEPTELPSEFELEIPRLGQSLKVRLVWSRDKNYGVMFREGLSHLSGDDVTRLVSAPQTLENWVRPDAALERLSPPLEKEPRTRVRGRRERPKLRRST